MKLLGRFSALLFIGANLLELLNNEQLFPLVLTFSGQFVESFSNYEYVSLSCQVLYQIQI